MQSTCSRILQDLHVLHSWVTQSHAESLEEIIIYYYYDKELRYVLPLQVLYFGNTVVPVCEALTTERWTLSRDLTPQLGLKGQ